MTGSKPTALIVPLAYLAAIQSTDSQGWLFMKFGLWIPQRSRPREGGLWMYLTRPLPSCMRNRGALPVCLVRCTEIVTVSGQSAGSKRVLGELQLVTK